MMQRYVNPPAGRWPELVQRPMLDLAAIEAQVQPILRRVRDAGDAALVDYCRRFDGVALQRLALEAHEIQAACAAVPRALQEAIQLAHDTIEAFHRTQLEVAHRIETAPGVYCWRQSVPIEPIGLYIPGGTAPLFSTVLMLGIPARLAGCREIVLCSPPDRNGRLAPAIVYAASLLGIRSLFRIGGAQAIAAMAYGTESVPRVAKIFGPGNQYVTAAKQLVSRDGTAIDLPAGPTELAVVADASCKPAYVAADLLSQAEHGPDSQVVLLSDRQAVLDAVEQQLSVQLEALPRREIAARALAHSKSIVFPAMARVMAFVNTYAPEHLILAVDEPEKLAAQVRNAGSVFLGHYAPEAAGDYASGTNHTLPTNGWARAYSGVSVDSFVKKITFQHLTPTGLQAIGPAVEKMAEAEGLTGHKQAISIRLRMLREEAAP